MNNSRSGALMPCARSTSTVRFEKPRPSNFWPRSMDLIQRSSALRERGDILTVAASVMFGLIDVTWPGPCGPNFGVPCVWGGVVKRRLLCAIKWFLDPRNARPPGGPLLPRLARAAADSRAHWSAVRLIHTWPQRATSPGINSATRVAPEEGILPGGGVALLRAGRALDKLKGENEDQKHGVEMVKKALSWPARQIAINAGEDGSVIVGKIQDSDTYAFGFDAQTGKFENLVSKGIIDPTKVVRTALQDAASIAGLLMTTEAMVAEVPKKQSPAPAMPGGGMGGMDY
jgi:TCP-1/cpn60 chaperonin family